MIDKRAILFRGKHVHILPKNDHLDGLWVYGYPCDKDYINVSYGDEYGGTYTSETLVHPDTVCQYTGLDDKNGKKIFEGDIVKAYGNIYAVFWDRGNCEIGVKNDKEGLGIANFYPGDMEVIGNIFDDPELVKGWG